MQLVEHELGREAREYIRWCFSHGNTLSKLLDERLSSSAGTITTLLPPTVDSEDLLDFMGGEKLPPRPRSEHIRRPGSVFVPIPTSKREWARRIHEHLAAGTNRIGVFEDRIAQPGDSSLHKVAPPLVFFEDEVYHVVESGSDEEAIITRLDDAFSIPVFAGALTSASDEELPHPLSGAAIDRSHLELLASRATAILVGAYDGEGFLMWRAADS